MNDIRNGLQWMLHQSIENAGVGRLVQYIHAGDEQHDAWDGHETCVTQTLNVRGIFIADECLEEIRDGVLTQVERRVLLVAADRLAASPNRRDRVIDGSTTYAVTHWEHDTANAAYRLTLRREA